MGRAAQADRKRLVEEVPAARKLAKAALAGVGLGGGVAVWYECCKWGSPSKVVGGQWTNPKPTKGMST